MTNGSPLPDADAELLTGLLTRMVGCRSDNPGSYESGMAALVVKMLQELTSCEITLVDSMPGRPSVAAVLQGSQSDAPSLVINGHLDTVPVDDETLWTFPPFEATVRDGLVYGRGACDMKAGLAAQIAVAAALSRRPERLAGSLILHFAAGEERAEPGTRSLLEAGFGGTYGIVTEPTDLAVAGVARGLAYYDIRIEGRSVHSSRPPFGCNPIAALPAVLEVLNTYGATIGRQVHPLLPPASSSPTIVRGGEVANMIPDVAHLVIDRRMLPHEDAVTELETLRHLLQGAAVEEGIRITVEQEPMHFASADGTSTDTLGRTVREVAADVTGDPREAWGTPYSSDMRVLVNEGGMEAVTFGPGSITQAHAPDEHVEVSQVVAATRILTDVAEKLLRAP